MGLVVGTEIGLNSKYSIGYWEIIAKWQAVGPWIENY